jgi:hypothetical protein
VLFSSETSQFPEQIGFLYLSVAFFSRKFLNEATVQGCIIECTASGNEIEDHKVTIHLRSPPLTLLLLLLVLSWGALVCDHTPCT